MVGGRIVRSGGVELAEELEAGGYEAFRGEPAGV
jgi:Fe-S cluster assembly ATPase SufC